MVIGIALAAVVNTGVLERTLTAVTIGSHKLTAAELNYYYLDSINSNAYISYMVTAGVPLDEQEYAGDEYDTWADYFLDTAITTARNTYAVYDEAPGKRLYPNGRRARRNRPDCLQHVRLCQFIRL